MYLTRFRTYKIALPPQTKTYGGRGPQTDKHVPPRPFTGQCLRNGLESISYLVHRWLYINQPRLLKTQEQRRHVLHHSSILFAVYRL